MEEFKNDEEQDELNDEQREAVKTVEGPLLVFAGPGTGKTKTLIARAVYMIVVKGIDPNSILMATFTEKAATELKTKLTEELAKRHLNININDMYIGTFHSIFQRILMDNLEYTRLKHEYTLIDDFDQQYLIFKHKKELICEPEGDTSCMEGADSIYDQWSLDNPKGLYESEFRWTANDLKGYFDTCAEELIKIDNMAKDEDPAIAVRAKMFQNYQKILEEENKIDFAGLETECYKLLDEHKDILDKLQEQIQYLMIDEYQDTNYIQEQLILKLGTVYDNEHKITRQNICVVGDDDQSLYRFRGATVQNILKFEDNFKEIPCKKVVLKTNYRSNSDIIKFYSNWMKKTVDFEWKDNENEYRVEKDIRPSEPSKLVNSKAVVKLGATQNEQEWFDNIYKFIKALKDSGRIKDYNQIAFLFNSVKTDSVRKLADFLEQRGINVYSPRSGQFFLREEIMALIGCFICMFPFYKDSIKTDEETDSKNILSHKYNGFDFNYIKNNNKEDNLKGDDNSKKNDYEYYKDCIKKAEDLMKTDAELNEFINKNADIHKDLDGTLDYGFTGLLYQLFEFPSFSKYLDVNMAPDTAMQINDERPARNLSIFSGILKKYEQDRGIKVLTGALDGNARKMDKDVNYLFNTFLRLQASKGIDEYQDDSEYAPKGCVSFMTIYQAKGLEFPIVFIGLSDSDTIRFPIGKAASKKEISKKIELNYFKRQPFEPPEKTPYFDFWREYYTAFSRAQDLLILTCNEGEFTYNGKKRPSPSKYIAGIYNDLPDIGKFDHEEIQRFLSEFTFHEVRPVKLMKSLSFTSHIEVYETCPLQYKFYKEFEFMPVREAPMIFGSLIHETIEDINKKAMEGKQDEITEENIKNWLNVNYGAISLKEHTYLDKKRLEQAFEQVQRYVQNNADRWSDIKKAEVDVSLIQPDENYIIEGKVDLIRSIDDDHVELIDFKSEPKERIEKFPDRIGHYRDQLQLYAYLIEHREPNIKISQMHLYCTSEDKDPMINFTRDDKAATQADIEATAESFKDTARKILQKDFTGCAKEARTCSNCDFRFYCKMKRNA